MRISYNKLWKLLIDKNMNKNDLKATAGISSASVVKLGKGENITTDVLLKICESLNVHRPLKETATQPCFWEKKRKIL